MAKSQEDLERLAQEFLAKGQLPPTRAEQPGDLESLAQQFLQQQVGGNGGAEGAVGMAQALGVGIVELAKGVGRAAAGLAGSAEETPEARRREAVAEITGLGIATGRALAESAAAALDLSKAIDITAPLQRAALKSLGVEDAPPFYSWLATNAHGLEQRANDALAEMVTSGRLSEQKARDLNMLGGVVGYAAPGTAAYKMAGLFSMIRGLSVLGAPVAQEATAGVIFSGVFSPGDAEARAKQAALNGSLGMVFGVVFNPTRATLGMYRNIRKVANTEGARVLRTLEEVQDVSTGTRIPKVKEDQSAALMAQMNQEYYITQSPRAMEIVQRTADYRASVAAVAERSQSGVVRGVGDLDNLLPKLQEEFPDLKFDTKVTGPGQGDVFFGPKGLSTKGGKQSPASIFKRTGHFPGQKVMLLDKEYSFVNTVGGKVRVRDGRGRPHTFKQERVKFLDEGTVDLAEFADDALVDDLLGFWKQQQDAAAESRQVPTQPSARRNFPNSEGAVVNPEELGIPAELLAQGEPGAPLPSYPNKPWMEMVREWARDREILKRVQERDPRGRFAGAKVVEPSDLDAIATRASQKLELEVRGLLDPDELVAFDAIDDALTRMAEADATNLNFLAPASRHSVRRLEDGQIYARHLDSGAAILFENERAAVNGFLEMRGMPRAFDGGMGMPPILSRGGGVSGGAPVDPEGSFELFIPERILDPANLPEGEIRQGITSRAWRVLMTKPVSNIVDWSARVETVTGGRLPLWSQGIKKLDDSVVLYNNRIFPEASAQHKIFEHVSGKEAQRMGDVLFEAKGLDAAATRSKMAEMGVGEKGQAAAFLARRYDERRVVPMLRNELGIDVDSYLDFHYRVLQPVAEHFGIVEESAVRAQFAKEFGKEMPDRLWQFVDDNRGALAFASKDPRDVLGKVMRQGVNEVTVRPTERALAALATRENPLGIRELDPEAQAQVIRAVGGEEQLQNMASVLSGAVEAVRGYHSGIADAPTKAIVNIMRGVGGNPKPAIVKSVVNMMLANVYGATMGLRPAIIMRDWWQVYWNMGTRVGFGTVGEAMERSLDPEVVNKWRMAGAFDPEAVPIPRAEEFMNPDLMGALPEAVATGEIQGISGAIARFASKAQLRAAHLNRRMLSGYSKQDEFLRTWAAESQSIKTDRMLRRFEAGNITEKKFLRDGLAFYEKSKKEAFMRLWRAGQREDALLMIGREAAHETNFIYRRFAQAPWLQQSGIARGLMQFITWPMWQSEMYLRRMWLGGWENGMKFAARNAALFGALKLLAHQTGTDTSKWISPTQWFGYTSGPQLDAAIDFKEFWSAPAERKASAGERMVMAGLQVQLPGMGLVRDVTRVAENAQSPEHAFFIAAVGFPQDLPGNYWMDIAVDPSRGAGTPLTAEALTQARAEAKAKRLDAFLNPVRPLPPQVLQPGLAPPPPSTPPLPQLAPGFSTGDAFLDRTFGIRPAPPSAQLPSPVGPPASGLSQPAALLPAPQGSPTPPQFPSGGSVR